MQKKGTHVPFKSHYFSTSKWNVLRIKMRYYIFSSTNTLIGFVYFTILYSYFVIFYKNAKFGKLKFPHFLPYLKNTSSSNFFLSTIKTHPGYPWVSGCRLGNLETNIIGPELDHQVLKRLDPKNCWKVAKFDIKRLFLRGFLLLIFIKLDDWA